MNRQKRDGVGLDVLAGIAGSDTVVDYWPNQDEGPRKPVLCPTLPVCVVDLNALRATRHSQLPQSFTALVPQAILFELKGMEHANPELRQSILVRMRRVFAMNPHFFVGRHFNDLVEEELLNGRAMSIVDVVDIKDNRNLRAHTSTEWRWSTFMGPHFGAKSVRRYENLRKHFREMRLLFAQLIKPRSEEMFGKSLAPEPVLKSVQEYRVIREWVSYLYGNRVNETVWDPRLDRFPDEYAIGRLARVSMSYMALAWLGQTSKMDNDWEDLEYAFLATYAKGIVTADRRLIRVVRNCNPGILVFRNLEEAGEHFSLPPKVVYQPETHRP